MVIDSFFDDEKWWKSPDFDGAGVFSGSIGSCFGVSSKETRLSKQKNILTVDLPLFRVKNLKISDWLLQPNSFFASTFASYLESSSRLSEF